MPDYRKNASCNSQCLIKIIAQIINVEMSKTKLPEKIIFQICLKSDLLKKTSEKSQSANNALLAQKCSFFLTETVKTQ